MVAMNRNEIRRTTVSATATARRPAAQRARSARCPVAGHDTPAEDENSSAVHRDRLPVGERGAQARQQRARAPAILEHDQCRREPRWRASSAARTTMPKQHRDLRLVASPSSASSARSVRTESVEQRAAVDERRRQHGEQHAREAGPAHRQQRPEVRCESRETAAEAPACRRAPASTRRRESRRRTPAAAPA